MTSFLSVLTQPSLYLQRVQDYGQKARPLIFSYIVASDIFDQQTGIPGVEFSTSNPHSRGGKNMSCKAQFQAHTSKIQWRIMAMPYC